MSRIIVITLAMLAFTAKAQAQTGHLNHSQTKGIVRLSLWYEGTNSYDKSMFKPGAAEKLLKESNNQGIETPQMSEELAVALDNLRI